ncbi:MAG: RHS repeat domain-containing protein, partial [Paracoccaceae bacterium]
MGEETKFTYDSRGNQIWVEDANGYFFGKRYDAMGRLTLDISFTQKAASLDHHRERRLRRCPGRPDRCR